MKFIKYLLGCIIIDPIYEKHTIKQIVVFIIELFVFVGLLALYGYGIFRYKFNNEFICVLVTIFATICTILVFCLISIIVEDVIKGIKNLFKRNKTKE